MRYYSRKQVLELLEIDEGFLVGLEQEEIVSVDSESEEEFSERMLERVRVAHNLVAELDVNLAGAAVIVRMREELAGLRMNAVLIARRGLKPVESPGDSAVILIGRIAVDTNLGPTISSPRPQRERPCRGRPIPEKGGCGGHVPHHRPDRGLGNSTRRSERHPQEGGRD